MTKIKGFSGTRKLTFPNRFQPRVCTHHVSHQQTHFHLPSAFAKLIAHARPLAPDFAADLRRASFLLCLRTWSGRRNRPISAQEHHSQRNHPVLYRQKKKNGSDYASNTPFGNQFNSRRWTATRWLANIGKSGRHQLRARQTRQDGRVGAATECRVVAGRRGRH